MKKIAILSGAGISAESGIKTFRDSDGLWENYNVEDVASIEGWYRDPKLVLEFYNQRRRQLETVKPNAAHYTLAELEKHFDVAVITQNVDNLHERAGSTNILHLHGELTKACSNRDKSLVHDIGYNDIQMGDTAEDGSQLRPFIVWFGEAVPLIPTAAEIISKSDILVIIGTSLNVYPAASLAGYFPSGRPIFLIDPKNVNTQGLRNVTAIQEVASTGTAKLKELLLNSYC